MKTKSILNFRNAYEGIFSSIRRTHMKKLVRKLKRLADVHPTSRGVFKGMKFLPSIKFGNLP